jgi:hypothetical protein
MLNRRGAPFASPALTDGGVAALACAIVLDVPQPLGRRGGATLLTKPRDYQELLKADARTRTGDPFITSSQFAGLLPYLRTVQVV